MVHNGCLLEIQNCSLLIVQNLQMSLNLNLNPQTITQSRIISYTDTQAIVSFCVKFSLTDPTQPSVIANSMSTAVALGLDLTKNIGITGIIEDEEDQYQVEAFECDQDGNAINAPSTRNQGASIRVCVKPDAFTRSFGVVLRSINVMRLERGDVSQKVIEPDSVVQDFQRTEYMCTVSQDLCHVQTDISNDFFWWFNRWTRFWSFLSGGTSLYWVSGRSLRVQFQQRASDATAEKDQESSWRHDSYLCRARQGSPTAECLHATDSLIFLPARRCCPVCSRTIRRSGQRWKHPTHVQTRCFDLCV